MSLEEGARIAVETCMNVAENDMVMILCDEGTEKIGEALGNAASEWTNHVLLYKLEVYGKRPILCFPDSIKKAAREATVGFWTARAYEDEYEHIRGPFIKTMLMSGRHAHMVNITEEIFKTGIAVDYFQVRKFTDKVYDLLRNTKVVRVTNEQGTDLVVKFSDEIRWVSSTGICHFPGQWVNLPDGEIFTAPKFVEGKIVADGVIGDYLGHKYRHKDLQRTPINIDTVTDDIPRYTSIQTDNEELLRELKGYLGRHPYSGYIGEIALGTNILLKGFVDNMLQDEKFPGVHLAFGNPLPEVTGASWSCPTHMDIVLTKCNVWLDDKKVMEEGKYII